MNHEELNNLKVGDKVKWVGLGGSASGEVVERLKGKYFRVRWDDGHTEILNPRSGHDQKRAKNIELAKESS